MTTWAFVCRRASHFVLISFRYICLRCQICSLSGDALVSNEYLRRELCHLEREAENLCDAGLLGKGLQKLEQKVELMEKHWEEFCLEVQHLFSFIISFSQLPKMYFRCELGAIEAGDREKAQKFKKMSLDLAGSISDNFRRIMLESGREQAEELSAMIELIKNLGS